MCSPRFSKKQVLFTAFKVKDAKKIALVLQENNKKLSLISLYECIKENSNLKNSHYYQLRLPL